MEFLATALVFLVAAILVVPVCKRLGLSAVLGYLLAGVLLGPSALAFVKHPEDVLHFAEIGVVLLLFIIGLELQPKRLWVMRQAVFGLGSLQVTITSIAVALPIWLLFELSWQAALVLGFSLALSSTAFVLQLLGEQKKLNQPHGRSAFGVLLFQDIAVIPAILLLNTVQPSDQGGHAFEPLLMLYVVAGLIAARFLLRPLLRIVASTGIHELFVAAALSIVVGAALAMHAAGLSMGLGAFVAGMMVADSEYRHQLETDVMPFKGLLLGLFFMAVGMATNLSLLAESPGLILAGTIGLVLIKALTLYPLARLMGLVHAEALRAAVVLSQGGEFAFVLLTAAGDVSLITDHEVEPAVLIVTLSMVSTPFLVSLLERLLHRGEPERAFDTIDEPEHPVVIAGFGRFGQIVARVLNMRHIPFTALEPNPQQVDFVRRFGNEIYFGDPARLDLLRNAHVGEARVFVLALEDQEAALKVAELVRESFPNVYILAVAQDRQHELALREIGVQYVIRLALLSSLAMAESVLLRLGLAPEEAADAIETFKSHDARTLDDQAAVFHNEEAFREAAQDAAQELRDLFDADEEAEHAEQSSAPPTA